MTKLVVGGAQLGMAYGITNRSGCPAPAHVAAMLQCAIANGSDWIDTAHAYAGSEEAIGRALADGLTERVRIVTKLAPLADSPAADPEIVRARVDASIAASCARLRVTRLNAVLLHRASQLDTWDGAVWRRLCEIAQVGVIGALGVSVQTPIELERALEFEDVRFVQMPFNILDCRWNDAVKRLSRERANRPITVHVRSALLQGLLVRGKRDHWRCAHVDDPGAVQDWLEQQSKQHGRVNVIDLCLAFVRSQSWIDGVVVGMETIEQLQDNIRYFLAPELTPSQLSGIERERPMMSNQTLDPSQWSSK